MKPEEDYEKRLAERVAEWEAKNPEQAAELRLAVRREAGLIAQYPPESFIGRVLERNFREKVRALKGWPTARQWAAKEK